MLENGVLEQFFLKITDAITSLKTVDMNMIQKEITLIMICWRAGVVDKI